MKKSLIDYLEIIVKQVVSASPPINDQLEEKLEHIWDKGMFFL